jgi:hypothetical protein
MRFHWCLLLFLICAGAAAQERKPAQSPSPEPQVHNTVELPKAAHQPQDVAGSFTDPITRNEVYRLSDRALCPHGADHFYSYTSQFSAQGRMVFDCFSDPASRWATTHPIYDSDFRLLDLDAALAAGYVNKFGKAMPLKMVQWSHEREVLFGQSGFQIVELDPFARKSRVFADFSVIREVVISPDGARIPVRTAKELSVGPGDRLMVHLQCRKQDAECPQDWLVVGIGVFDPATGKYSVLGVPVPGDKAPAGFDEGQWTMDPAGRLMVVYGNAPGYLYNADLSSRVKVEDNHGHRGYFCGSNGHCYMVRVINDDLPQGRVGQIGCRDSAGKMQIPWRSESGLYDDKTGKRVLVFGCDIPGQNAWQHFATSLGARDVFGISAERFTFPPSLEKFVPTDEAILRAVVSYSGGEPSRVDLHPVAYHRSATGPRSKLMGRLCDYWAQPRVVGDSTGNRFLFESTVSHPEWPATEAGTVKTDCITDVYVAEYSPR